MDVFIKLFSSRLKCLCGKGGNTVRELVDDFKGTVSSRIRTDTHELRDYDSMYNITQSQTKQNPSAEKEK